MEKLKETIQAERFDECVAELSPEAQAFFDFAVEEIQASMANGGGEKSAKALLFAICKLDKPFVLA
jgi:hypothetical protein